MARDVGERLERLWAPEHGEHQRGDEPSAGELRGGTLPPELSGRFEGELAIRLRPDRPTIVSNFVSTLDGVVAMTADGTTGGGEVSGFSEPDRFLMAMLRSLADAVIVAAGTFGADPQHEWTPRRVHPPTAEATSAWRSRLGLAPQPTTVVITASGRLDPGHPAFAAPDVPALVITTASGAAELLRRDMPSKVRVETVGDGERVPAAEILRVVAASGVRLAICEGGPQLLGELLAADLVDELFLTLAPQLAGRSGETRRRSLIEGASLGEKDGRWGELRSVHRAAGHLFLRYALRA